MHIQHTRPWMLQIVLIAFIFLSSAELYITSTNAVTNVLSNIQLVCKMILQETSSSHLTTEHYSRGWIWWNFKCIRNYFGLFTVVYEWFFCWSFVLLVSVFLMCFLTWSQNKNTISMNTSPKKSDLISIHCLA